MKPTRKSSATPLKIRRRSGSWNTFVRRFQPIDSPQGEVWWHGEQLPKAVDARLVWTIVDGDNGRLYVSPGFHRVNRIDYVLCRMPWSDDDARQPDYLYD